MSGKRRRGCSPTSQGEGSSPFWSKPRRTPSASDTFSPLQSPFPDMTDDRHGSMGRESLPRTSRATMSAAPAPGEGSMVSPTPQEGSMGRMRPPTPRHSALGESFRPATPHSMVSPTHELPACSRNVSVLSEARRRAGSRGRNSFFDEGNFDSSDNLPSELLEMSTAVLNQSRANHLEESLLMAKSRSDLYEQELIAEMDRSSALASKAARLEEANNTLKEQLCKEREKVAAHARQICELEGECKQLRARTVSSNTEDAPNLSAELATQKLHELETALLRGQRDLELATCGTQDSKAECIRLEQRLRAAEERAAEAAAAASTPPAGADAEGVSQLKEEVKGLEVLLKHMRRELEAAKADARDVVELRKEAGMQAAALRREGELKERLERVEAKLGSVVESEAALARERDALISWKLGVHLGLPELAGPSQVVRAYRSLQQSVIMLEEKSGMSEERCLTLSSKVAAAEAACKDAGRRMGELDALVLALEQELVVTRAEVAREKRATALEQEINGSFNAEALLMQNNKVSELEKAIRAHKTQLRELKASSESALNAAKDESAKRKEECEGVQAERDALALACQKAEALVKSTREELRACEAEEKKAKEEVARVNGIARKAQEQERHLSRELDQLKAQAAKDATAAKQATAQAAAEKEEQQKLVQAAAEKNSKAQAQIRLLLRHAYLERLLPLLVGYSFKVHPGKVVEGCEVTVIGEASDALALSPTVVRFKATIPGDAGGEVTVELTNVPDSMSEAKAKYLPETGAGAARGCGIPCLLASQLEAHYKRLLPSQPDPHTAAAAAQGSAAPGRRSPTLAPPALSNASATAGGGGQAVTPLSLVKKEGATVAGKQAVGVAKSSTVAPAPKTVVSLSSAAAKEAAAAAGGAAASSASLAPAPQRTVVKLPPTS